MRKVSHAKTTTYELSQNFAFYMAVPKQRNTPACINYTFDSAEKLNLTKAFVVVLKW